MAHDLSRYDEDGQSLFLFTSLTAGSSHIVTATARIETILTANRLAYVGVDVATDETARRLWARRSQGKKLPGLVAEGYVLAVGGLVSLPATAWGGGLTSALCIDRDRTWSRSRSGTSSASCSTTSARERRALASRRRRRRPAQ